MVISNKYLIQFLYNSFQRFCPHVPNQMVDLFAFLHKFLPTGFPLHPEFTIPAMGTVMCKTQECEGLRLTAFPRLIILAYTITWTGYPYFYSYSYFLFSIRSFPASSSPQYLFPCQTTFFYYFLFGKISYQHAFQPTKNGMWKHHASLPVITFLPYTPYTFSPIPCVSSSYIPLF